MVHYMRERYIYIYIRETAKHIYFSGRASKIGHENWWASMEETWQKNMARIIHGKKREDTMISYVYN